MSVEQVGPGGVSNSYGVRGTSAKQEYDNDKEYKEVFVPKDTIPLTATVSSSGGIEFDAPTTDAIIAIAGDAGSGGTAQIVDGYPVEVTGTSEVLVSAVPCDVVWIAHNGVAGTLTVRDAGVTGTGIAAAKTIDMAATATLQPGSLRTQFGVTATLTAGKATFWVRPL